MLTFTCVTFGSSIKSRIKLLFHIDEADIEDVLLSYNSFLSVYFGAFLGEALHIIISLIEYQALLREKNLLHVEKVEFIAAGVDLFIIFSFFVASYIFKKEPSLENCNICMFLLFFLILSNAAQIVIGLGIFKNWWYILFLILMLINFTSLYLLHKYKIKLVELNETTMYSESYYSKSMIRSSTASRITGRLSTSSKTSTGDRTLSKIYVVQYQCLLYNCFCIYVPVYKILCTAIRPTTDYLAQLFFVNNVSFNLY